MKFNKRFIESVNAYLRAVETMCSKIQDALQKAREEPYVDLGFLSQVAADDISKILEKVLRDEPLSAGERKVLEDERLRVTNPPTDFPS